MKGAVDMSPHEKEREQEDACTHRQKVIQPHPYIFISFSIIVDCKHHVFQCKGSVGKIMHKENKDVGMGLDDFQSLYEWVSSCSLSFS